MGPCFWCRLDETLCSVQAQPRQNFELCLVQPGRTFIHLKLSIFNRSAATKTAIIGSSNLTGGGLSSNYESNVFIDERKVVQQHLVRTSARVNDFETGAHEL
jgi:phosphatidylserine/phosphatidylglycerophosphate/cardiolipin synthase-like enzyme